MPTLAEMMDSGKLYDQGRDDEIKYKQGLESMYKARTENQYLPQREQAGIRSTNAYANQAELANKQTAFNQDQTGFMKSHSDSLMGQYKSLIAKGAIDEAQVPYEMYAKTMSTTMQGTASMLTQMIEGLKSGVDPQTLGESFLAQMPSNIPEPVRRKHIAEVQRSVDMAYKDPEGAIKQLQQAADKLGRISSYTDKDKWTQLELGRMGAESRVDAASLSSQARTGTHNTNVAQLAHNSATAAGLQPGTGEYNTFVNDFIAKSAPASLPTTQDKGILDKEGKFKPFLRSEINKGAPATPSVIKYDEKGHRIQ